MDKVSYDPGNNANVFINANSIFTNKKIYLYSVSNVIVDSVTVNLYPQSIPITNTAPWENGYGYSISFNYIIPNNLKSGIYNWENKIFFVVKSVSKGADITIIYPSNTEAAYNNVGGKSLYNSASTNHIKSNVVSFLRPATPEVLSVYRLTNRFMRWLNNLSGYNVQVICDQDMDDYSEIQNSKIIVVMGHSEYWSRAGRLNFDKFLSFGKDAIILSGNTM